MKEITLKIPEKKLDFFIRLIDELGIEVKSDAPLQDKEIEIPEEHKAIVMERIKKSKQNPDRLLDWEKVKNNFRFEL